MPFEFKVLRSGSKGNATLVRSTSTAILIDCGTLVADAILDRDIRLSKGDVDAILVTHSHHDHAALRLLDVAALLNVPIFVHPTTLEDFQNTERGRKILNGLEKASSTLKVKLLGEKARAVGDLRVTPLELPHRGAGSSLCNYCCGFVVGWKKYNTPYRLGYATDLGHVPKHVLEHFAECNCIAIESNYDPNTDVPTGKGWVRTPYGHLSVVKTGKALRRIVDLKGEDSRLHHVVLAHLSETDNDPATARKAAKEHLEGAAVRPRITLANQWKALSWIRVDA